VKTPVESGYGPELDENDEMDDDNKASNYQSLIVIVHWVVKLGSIDIAVEVSTMAQFNCIPRTGHLRSTS
jgi:hypothetical protein